MAQSILLPIKQLRDRMNLGQQVAAVAGLLCLSLVLTVAATTALLARQQATAQVEASMIGVATNMAERLDARMFERFREIRNIAGLPPLQATWTGSPDGIRSVLEQLQSTLPEYAWIGFARPDGTVLAATGGLLEGASVAERPWFKDGLNGAVVKDVHDAKLLAALLEPNANGEPFRFVDVAVPVKNAAGQTIGVLGAHMSWTWASAVRTTVLQSLAAGSQTEIWVLGADGGVLLGPEYAAQPLDARTIADIKSRGSLVVTDATQGGNLVGAAATSGYLDYPGLGWIVIARQPLGVALAAANHLTMTIALIGLAFAALGVVLAALLTVRLMRPLKELVANIDTIGRQPGATMIGRDHTSRDITRLSVAIRSLLRRLGTAETAQEIAENQALLNKQMMDENSQRLGDDITALRILADTDPLTGLYNRRAFREFTVEAMNFFRRKKRSLGVLVIDIDFFKRVNDTYGHSVGDEVIKAVGQMVQQEARAIDKVARFGGEEFVVLMQETESEGPAVLAERIRVKIASQLIAHPDIGTISVTVSIGATMAIRSDRDIEDVIERADRALYKAKSEGRNRVVADEVAPKRRAA